MALNHPPQISDVGLGLGGGTNVFILWDQTTGHSKSHHLQARATFTAMSVPPFLSAELWVIRYHLGIIMHYRIYSQYQIMREKGF